MRVRTHVQKFSELLTHALVMDVIWDVMMSMKYSLFTADRGGGGEVGYAHVIANLPAAKHGERGGSATLPAPVPRRDVAGSERAQLNTRATHKHERGNLGSLPPFNPVRARHSAFSLRFIHSSPDELL